MKSILIIGFAALAMLTCININTNFAALSEKINPNLFHIEIGILLLYWIWLFWCYNNITQNKDL